MGFCWRNAQYKTFILKKGTYIDTIIVINSQQATDGVYITDEKLLSHTKLSHLDTFTYCHIKSSAYTRRMVIGGQNKKPFLWTCNQRAKKDKDFL